MDAGPLNRNEDADGGGTLARLLRPHATAEGLVPAPVPGVAVFRADAPTECGPCIYDPCVVIVIQGSKRGYLGTQTFNYDTSSYLTFSVPIPMEAEIIEASPEAPFLGICLAIEPAVISEIQLSIDSEVMPEAAYPDAISASPLDAPLNDAVRRLIETFKAPSDSRILGPMIVREIFYRVLLGNQGGALRAAVNRQGHYHRISQIMRSIQSDSAAPYTTAELAQRAGMSKTTFHESFKAIASATPLQYIKSIRLHQARNLMLNDGLSASAAGYRVGYTSPSQFSREFKRLFGVPPSGDTRPYTAGDSAPQRANQR